MLSTPDICCSIGVATDCATVWASAPVKLPMTWICGSAIFGNWEVGSPSIDTMPAMTIKIEITIATIGRLIKNLDMSVALGRRPNDIRLRANRCTFPDLHEALNNDLFSRLQPLCDDPIRPDSL